MPSFMIVRLQISEIIKWKQKNQAALYRSRGKDVNRAPEAQRVRKSKFNSAHAIPRHPEVLHAKFHDRTTSNLRDY